MLDIWIGVNMNYRILKSVLINMGMFIGGIDRELFPIIYVGF